MLARTRAGIKERNEQILEDYSQLQKMEPPYTLQTIFSEISRKYGITLANAKYIYYKKYKKINENESVSTEATATELDELSPTETVSWNGNNIRLFLYRNDVYVPSKDFIKACGLTYISKDLSSLLNHENRAIVRIHSSHGVVHTQIIRIDVCFSFLESLDTSRYSLAVKEASSHVLEVLRSYLSKQSSIKKGASETTKTNDLSPLSSYKAGEEVDFTVTSILAKFVIGVTRDAYQTSCIISIGDVCDRYIQNLRDYFTVGEVVTATIKQVDYERKRLSLSTRLSKTFSSYPNHPFAGLEEAYKRVQNSKDNLVSEVKSETAISNEQENKKDTIGMSSTDAVNLEASKELETLYNAICHGARIGALTPKAKTKLVDMVNEKGLVNVVSSVIETKADFQADLGLAFLNEVEKNIKKDYL